jgi:plasmid replication initiation protein
MAKELVTKSNSLINASYYLNLGEWRLITATAALARKDGIEITAERELLLSVRDFANLYDLDRTRAYTVLRSACDTLFDRQISYLETIDGKKMISRTRWVHKISYTPEENCVAVAFSPAVAPHIADLSQNFTTFYLENIKNLKSPYAVRLYEQFARWKNAGSTPEIDPEELKRLMGVEPHLYTTIRLFNRLLVSCVEKINKHTDLQVTLHQIKNWRKVTGYKFDVVVRDSVNVSPATLKLSAYQQRTWANKLVDAMEINREINRRLCRFPESSVSYTALRTAVAKALADQKIAATFLPLLKQVGFGKQGRKRVPRDEDGKPIVEDTISDTFSF